MHDRVTSCFYVGTLLLDVIIPDILGIGLGGGLIRSAGGWERLTQKRQEGMYQRSDERMLGDSNFVTKVLAQSKEQIKKSDALRAAGWDINKLQNAYLRQWG